MKTKAKKPSQLKPDLPILYIVLLASLAVPRVIMHDLRLVSFDSEVYKFAAIVPFLIWLSVALIRKTKRPFYDFVLLGLVYGTLLAVTHQVLWDASWAGNLPHIGGNLAGKLDPAAENLLLRTAAFISGIATGLVTGFGIGIVAATVKRVSRSAKKTA